MLNRVLSAGTRGARGAGRRIQRAYRSRPGYSLPHLREGHARISARHPELRLVNGRLSLPHNSLMPATAADRNRDLVVEALEAAGIDVVALAPLYPMRHRLGVAASQRAAALDALRARYADDGVYVHIVRHTPSVLGPILLVDQAPHDPEVAAADTIRVNRYYVATAYPLRYGPRYGCDVSFYDVEADRVLVPRPGDPPERVPPEWLRATTIDAGGRQLPAARDLQVPAAGAVDFPIDAVYLWVNGEDPQWQRRKAAALTGVPVEELTADSIDASRFRDNDELRYSLRSLEMFAPWIRHVYLVTDDQRPVWLRDEHPRLTVVDHREIFRDPDVLPNFNSQAISAQVHHIEGLSEQYLLMNDDVFFGRPVVPESFFHANGMSQFYLSRHFLDHGIPEPEDAPQYTARANSRRLIEELFGVVVKTTTKHTPIPQRRSVMAELEERFPDIFARNAASRFRDPSDHQIENVLHHWYAYCTGRAVPGTLSYAYVPLSSDEFAHELDRLLTRRRADAFCINDAPGNLTPDERATVISEFLRRYFPIPSSFEVAGA